MLQAQLEIARDKTLKYFDNDCAQVDHIYNNWRHLSWLKLRVEGVYLFHRKGHDRCTNLTPEQQKLCPVFTETCETVYHFLKCDKYRTKNNLLEIQEPNWLLSVDRNDEERTTISSAIKSTNGAFSNHRK